jgi:N utilization substance protein B
MNRRKAREFALQMLFQRDFTGDNHIFRSDGDLHDNGRETATVKSFARQLVKGTIDHLEEIDGIIERAAEHWKIDRMAAVDRNIVRCAVFEILYMSDIPPAVTINEALEIAKKYSSSESIPFINGLLDKVSRESGRIS